MLPQSAMQYVCSVPRLLSELHYIPWTCVNLTCIYLCYQITQAVELDLSQSNPICIYIDLLPELAGNTDVHTYVNISQIYTSPSREYTHIKSLSIES